MTCKRKDTSRAKAWQYQVGEYPNTVTAYERLDRRRTIELRWWVGELRRFQKKSLGFRIRDESGAIDRGLERRAVVETQEWHASLTSMRQSRRAKQGMLAVAAAISRAPQASAPALTLAKGFEIATRVPTGMYVVETAYLKEVRRAVRDLMWAIGTNDSKGPRNWDGLNYSSVREIWIRLAHRYVETGKGGPSWTEHCVAVFLQVSHWLAVEDLTGRVVRVKKTWREQMRREWEQITSTRINRKAPRHTEEEIAKIFAALADDRVDPRIALAVELGAEARLGQVRRLTRADVNLASVGAFSLGDFVVHGSGKKLGVARDLTPQERAAIDQALDGYLKDLERLYQAGLLKNYPIFPAGRLYSDAPSNRGGKNSVDPGANRVRRARPDVGHQVINTNTMMDMFHKLELVAGVTPVPGRGWYGIRRKATDLYEDYESDQRVLNDLTGHRSSETRRLAYQEREREEIYARAAETRRHIRATVFGVVEDGLPEARAGHPTGGRRPRTPLTPARGRRFAPR